MSQPFDLHAAAHQAMLDNGFIPDIPPNVTAEVARAAPPNGSVGAGVQDLRELPWSSIDNDTSRDLDQLEVAEKLPDGTVRIRVAIADVDGTVPQGSATDAFASANSTSVYTGIVTYPMLPDRLSTDLTSLVQDSDRASVVIEFVVAADGSVSSHDVYMARVKNHAKLAYNNVGAWLDGNASLPACGTQTIQDQLHLQDTVAQALRAVRAANGGVYGLGASVWTRSGERASRVARKLRAGSVWHNDHVYTYATAQATWGGRGESGFGRTHSKHGLYDLTAPKFVDHDSGRVPVPWWFPYDDQATAAFRGMAGVLYGSHKLKTAWRERRALLAMARRYRS